jgi:transcriptional regulator with PAS, ATPase and Fis domain
MQTCPVCGGDIAGDERHLCPLSSSGDPTIATAEPPPHILIRRFTLSVVDGPDTGKSCASQSDRLIVGTHRSAGLVLGDRAVSRFHCELTLEGDRIRVRDLSSRNGTRVDGVHVTDAFLGDGASISIGQTRLVLVSGDERVELPVSSSDRFGLMVGRSPALRAAFALLERAARSEATLLLEGETGTGKDAAAESVHRASGRADGPLVVVDCGAIPADLLESELFGHEKGAFTGAVAPRTGAFQAAHGGTIFLDEIGELDLALQPKLLRALEKREVKRVGSTAYEPVDVRVIAATNRSLRAEVNSRRFRSDLYYRLAVLDVRLPALRERKQDLPLLVDTILERLGVGGQPEAAELRTPEFLRTLEHHEWPGNVRELRNYIERCLALRSQPPLSSARGAVPAGSAVDVSIPLREARDRFQRQYLAEILKHHDSLTAAARAAGVDRIHFYRLLRRHGLRDPS